jgi:hypothetical protein
VPPRAESNSQDIRPAFCASHALKPLTFSFIVAKPVYTLLGRKMVGTADRDDDVEHGAVLLGKLWDVKEDERIVVRGTLRVIRHRGDVVNGLAVKAWEEVRLGE